MLFDPLRCHGDGPKAAKPIRVVVADDFRAMLDRLESFIESLENLTVVGTANNGYEAWDAIVKLKPDLALLDLQMPGLTGLEVASRVRAGKLATQVVILSLHEGPEVRSYCTAAGASGFVSKHCLVADLPPELARLLDMNIRPVPDNS
jgi:two-component system response regulator DesR